MDNQQQPAMPTLLDCFAMAALKGLIARGDYPTQQKAAEAAYSIAHEMIKEKMRREKEALSEAEILKRASLIYFNPQ